MSDVCASCFSNCGIKSFIKKGEFTICSFCQKNEETKSITEVINYIKDCINCEYEESSNGCDCIQDVFERHNFKASTGVKTHIIQNMQGRYGSRIEIDTRSFPSNILPHIIQWNNYSEVIKEKMRFFSKEYQTEHNDFGNMYNPSVILDRIINFIRENIEDFIYKIEQETAIFRARSYFGPCKNGYNSKNMGYPENNFKVSTRMTPLGIPAFYAANKIETAIKEIKTTGKKFILGKWKFRQPINLLDLTIKQKGLPDFFNLEKKKERSFLKFFNKFYEEISTPIEKDEKEHIDYLPTQAVSELIKMSFKDIHGILYTSSYGRGENICLFPERVKFSDSMKFIMEENNKPICSFEKSFLMEN